jgi:hypothetical protein
MAPILSPLGLATLIDGLGGKPVVLFHRTGYCASSDGFRASRKPNMYIFVTDSSRC